MLFYGSVPKSKRKNPPKAVREQYDQWLLKHSPKPIAKKVFQPSWTYKLSAPPGRETVRYDSLDTGLGVATKSAPKVYTGDKVKGIATMHKSNAVPVFTDEQAVEISSMRR
jgi:hypothetical protein